MIYALSMSPSPKNEPRAKYDPDTSGARAVLTGLLSLRNKSNQRTIAGANGKSCALTTSSSLKNEPRVKYDPDTSGTRAILTGLLSLRNKFNRVIKTIGVLVFIFSVISNGSVQAQTDSQVGDSKVKVSKANDQTEDQTADQTFLHSDWKASEAIHAGNQRLIEGDAASALEAYDQAADLEPNAPEIPFVQGLAQYAQQDYESARRSFERAATAKDTKLANDALYSLGTTYHAQALQQTKDPKAAIASLEQALQQYRMVLDQDPHHKQALDANRKAAAMRRQLRQMMQQQEKQKKSDSENNEEKEKKDKQDQQKSDSDKQEKNDQDKSDQEKEQQQQESDKDSEQQESQQQDESSKDKQKKDQKSEASENQEQKDQKEKQATAKQQEESETSKQAKRQLREMMQAMRDRKKNRQQPVQRVPAKPVDKDW